jgi:hypothetical protein
MTEAEWLSCREPQAMPAFLRDNGKLSERKARLFAVACCRHIWHLFTDDNNRRAVEVSERLADGLATNTERRAAALAAGGGSGEAGGAAACAVGVPPLHAAERASANAARAFATASELPLLSNHHMNPAWQRLVDAERASQCNLLRDIFGPLPFRQGTVERSWLAWHEGLTARLAQATYEQRSLPDGRLDGSRLGILADALEEANCQDEEVLKHLREQEGHWRGCWVLDLLLGKS